MKIIEVKENKKQYLDLLLLADEQEDMVDRYLNNGKMYVLDDNGVKCECVITDKENDILEIKNIATVPEYQGKGYARALIEFIVNNYREQYERYFLVSGMNIMLVLGIVLSDESVGVNEILENAIEDAKKTILNVRKMLEAQRVEGETFYD